MPEGYAGAANADGSQGEDDAEAEEGAGGQPAELLQCFGLFLGDASSPLYSLRSSVENFVRAGQPRTAYAEQETDPLQAQSSTT